MPPEGRCGGRIQTLSSNCKADYHFVWVVRLDLYRPFVEIGVRNHMNTEIVEYKELLFKQQRRFSKSQVTPQK